MKVTDTSAVQGSDSLSTRHAEQQTDMNVPGVQVSAKADVRQQRHAQTECYIGMYGAVRVMRQVGHTRHVTYIAAMPASAGHKRGPTGAKRPEIRNQRQLQCQA